MTIGDKFPDLLGVDAEGKEVKLSDFPGKKFIIYFYPKDNTPGCTLEAKSFRDNYETFLSMGYQVIGVSKDSEASHQKFAAKQELPFPLIADTDLRLIHLADVWQKKKMAGREYWGVVRTTYVIDEHGVIEKAMSKVKPDTNAAEILDYLKSGQ